MEERNDKEDDVVFEAVDEIDAERELTPEDRIKQLRKKLKDCQTERQQYLDGWQRLKADHLNSKKRAEAEQERVQERHTAAFIERLLPLCDSFEGALKSLDTDTGAQSATWKVGIEQIHSQLMQILRSYSVTTVVPEGSFDPRFHEAVSEAPVSDPKEHQMIQAVLQSGYMVGDRLIRPAKVVVGRYEKLK